MKYFNINLIPICAMILTFYIAFFGSYKGYEDFKFTCIIFVLMWYLVFMIQYCTPLLFKKLIYQKDCYLIQRIMNVDNDNFKLLGINNVSYEITTGDLKGYLILLDNSLKKVSIHYDEKCIVSTNAPTTELYNKLKAI